MAVILHIPGPRAEWWLDHMRTLMPDQDVRPWHEPGEESDVEYAVVWKHPAGGLNRFKNLRFIVSIGAGIDHVLADPELPENVPIVRTTGADLKQRMREYVVLHVLRFHRRLPEIEAAQAKREWLQLINPPANERGIGVMGLGNLGADCAGALTKLGFETAGWSRSPKVLNDVTTFAGREQLAEFLARTEILVNLLPLTQETKGILNADLFGGMPKGAFLINAARGGHLVEADLLAALESGQIGGATLDVFDIEPLPADHPFWDHPQILVTPHVASLIDPVAGGKAIVANLRRLMKGEAVADLANREAGY